MGRIRQIDVAPLFPEEGPVMALLFGEAPGPRGADQSEIPFWGDRAGVQVYRALAELEMACVPEAAWECWDGARLRERGFLPRIRLAALSNAFPRCPTSDGESFRAPTNRELSCAENLARIAAELHRAVARCPSELQVIAFGKRAEWLLRRIEGAPHFTLHALPHPSAQGLLQAAPDKGRGQRLADLQSAWEAKLRALLRRAAATFSATLFSR